VRVIIEQSRKDLAASGPDGATIGPMSKPPRDPNDFTRSIHFRPRHQDPEVLRELAEHTKLQGAQLIRHALAELLRRDRARRAREKRPVAA